MPDVKVYQDSDKAAKGLASWTFTIDGQESLYWCPHEAAVNRVIDRLNKGRSGEAFDGAGTVNLAKAATAAVKNHRRGRGKVEKAADEAVVKTVTTKSGKTKVRETRPGFVYTLDGKAHEKPFTSELDARAACAWEAFKTRGKLGRFAEAEAAFKELTGKKGKCHLLGRKVALKDQDGALWSVGIWPDQPIRFKKVVPAKPDGGK